MTINEFLELNELASRKYHRFTNFECKNYVLKNPYVIINSSSSGRYITRDNYLFTKIVREAFREKCGNLINKQYLQPSPSFHTALLQWWDRHGKKNDSIRQPSLSVRKALKKKPKKEVTELENDDVVFISDNSKYERPANCKSSKNSIEN
jgi:hypothetical protein